jgi:hypothetical protein
MVLFPLNCAVLRAKMKFCLHVLHFLSHLNKSRLKDLQVIPLSNREFLENRLIASHTLHRDANEFRTSNVHIF